MPTNYCLTPRCPNPATYRGRCAGHARERETETHSDRSVYKTKRWRMLRRQRLLLTPFCACGCGRLGTDVDHIVPIRDGGAPFDLENTQTLTHECHAKKTRAEQRNRT